MHEPQLIGGLPLVSARGTPRAMGEWLGQALRPSLLTLTTTIADRLRTATDHGRDFDRDAMNELLAPAAIAINRFEPSLWMELEGISLGSGLPIEALLMIHGYADLLSTLASRMPPCASTYIGLGKDQTAFGTPLTALAWAPEAVLREHLVLIHRKPTNAPASLTLTVAGLHPVAGISQARLAVAWNELRVRDGTPGLMTAHLVAQALVSPDLATATARVSHGPRFGGGAVHVMAGDGRRCSIETSGQCTAQLGDPDITMMRIHTNHPIADEIIPQVSIVDDTSRTRLGRVARQAVENRAVEPRAIADWFGIDTKPTNPADFEEFMPQGIPEAGVVAVLDPAGGRMWIQTPGGGDGELRL